MRVRKLAILMMIFLSGTVSSHASSFTYSGEVTAGVDPLLTLIPIGSTLSGAFEIDVPGMSVVSTDTGIIESMLINAISPVTNLVTFCFNYNSVCTLGTEVPVIAVPDLEVEFDSLGQPAAGFIELTAFSSTFNLDIQMLLDLTNSTFSVEAVSIGSVSGVGNFELQPVPLPASLWLFSTAMAGLAGLRKRSNQATA